MARPEAGSQGGTPDVPRPQGGAPVAQGPRERGSFFAGRRLAPPAPDMQLIEPQQNVTRRPEGDFADPYENVRDTAWDPAFGLQHIGVPLHQRPKQGR